MVSVRSEVVVLLVVVVVPYPLYVVVVVLCPLDWPLGVSAAPMAGGGADPCAE
jgi:hypothetical protein